MTLTPLEVLRLGIEAGHSPDVILASLEAAGWVVVPKPQSTEWQPIDSAPKDGTVIRLYLPGHPELEGITGRWDTYQQDWVAEPMLLRLGPIRHGPDPTHWMPLSARPK